MQGRDGVTSVLGAGLKGAADGLGWVGVRIPTFWSKQWVTGGIIHQQGEEPGRGSGEPRLLLWSTVFEIPIRLPNSKSKFTSHSGSFCTNLEGILHTCPHFQMRSFLVDFRERATVPFPLRKKSHVPTLCRDSEGTRVPGLHHIPGQLLQV